MNFDVTTNRENDNSTKERQFRNSLTTGNNKLRPVSFADANELIPHVDSLDYRVDKSVIESAREHAGNIEEFMK